MVEFEIKVHPEQRLAYFPRIIVKEFGTKLKLLPNKNAAVLYNENASPDEVLASLRIIMEDIKLRARKKEAEK